MSNRRGYGRWLETFAPDPAEVEVLEKGGTSARIGVVVDARDTDRADDLEATLASVSGQLYRAAAVARVEHGSLAEAVAGLDADWITVLGPGAILQPRALAAVAAAVGMAGNVDVIYLDEDRLSPAGRRGEPVLKPAWSPRLLLAGNYPGTGVFFRAEAAAAVGGLHADDEVTGGYDLLLRLAELDRPFHHLPGPLVTLSRDDPWPPTAKIDAQGAAIASLERCLLRRGSAAAGAVEHDGPWLRRPASTRTPGVTVVVPTRDRLELLKQCLAGLDLTDYPGLKVLIADNDSTDEPTLAFLQETHHAVVRCPGDFNFSSIVNRAVNEVDTEMVVLLNNDIGVRDQLWLRRLVDEMRDGVGAVGCRLVTPEGEVTHEGVGLGLAGAVAVNLRLDGYLGLDAAVREVSAVTAACVLVDVAAFRAVRGFDTRLRVGYGDVDFCLRLWRQGYQVLYTPLATLEHQVGASRGDLGDGADERLFRQFWGDRDGRLRDLFLNPLIADLAPLQLAGAPDQARDRELRATLDQATIYARQLEREVEDASRALDNAAAALVDRERHLADLEAEQARASEHIRAVEARLQALAAEHRDLQSQHAGLEGRQREIVNEHRHLLLDQRVKDDYIALLKREAAEQSALLADAGYERDWLHRHVAELNSRAELREAEFHAAELRRLELVRYRLVDRLNEVMLRLPMIHRVVKILALRSAGREAGQRR